MKFSSIRRVTVLATTAALIVTGTAACNRTSDASGAGGSQIVLALSTLNNPFFVELRDGAQAAADAAGVQLSVVDAQNDSASQANQLANAAVGNTGVVIVNPVDSDAISSSVTDLVAAEIPVVAVDRTVNDAELASLVSSDNVAGGEQAAVALAESMGEQGDVIVLQGVSGTSASRERGEGFERGIAAYPNITVVASQTANFDRAAALDVTSNLLQANAGVTGIFAENDEMALGAIQALGARAGEEVKVVGFDGTADGLAAIDNGTLVATIAQQPALLGQLAIELAVKIMNGETIEDVVPVEVVSVTRDNVGDFTE